MTSTIEFAFAPKSAQVDGYNLFAQLGTVTRISDRLTAELWLRIKSSGAVLVYLQPAEGSEKSGYEYWYQKWTERFTRWYKESHLTEGLLLNGVPWFPEHIQNQLAKLA